MNSQPQHRGAAVGQAVSETPEYTDTTSTAAPMSNDPLAQARKHVSSPVFTHPSGANPTNSKYTVVPVRGEDGKLRLVWEEVDADPNAPAPFPGVWTALLSHNDLLLKFTTEYLNPRQLFTLYCIDQDFHEIVNNHLTTWMKASIRRWAPLKRPNSPQSCREAENDEAISTMTVFPWSCYRRLCIPDPAGRTTNLSVPASMYYSRPPGVMTNAPMPSNQAIPAGGGSSDTQMKVVTVRRWVPCFKYLFFLIHRARTTRSILRTMAWDHDVRFPEYMAVTLAKLWFLMDVPNNGMRTAIIHNREYMTDKDLRRAHHFLVKLDMIFSNPLDPHADPALRRLMFAQKSLEPLDEILLRCTFRSVDVAGIESAQLKTSFWSPHAEPEKRECLRYERFGSEWRQSGTGWVRTNPRTGQAEYRPLSRLIQPDELVVLESYRRSLGFHKQIKAMLRSGYQAPLPFSHVTPRIVCPQWWLDRKERMLHSDIRRFGTGYRLPPAPHPDDRRYVEPHPLNIDGEVFYFYTLANHEAVDFDKRYVVTEEEFQASIAERHEVPRGAEGSLLSPAGVALTRSQQDLAMSLGELMSVVMANALAKAAHER